MQVEEMSNTAMLEMSLSSREVRTPPGVADVRGRHRIRVELNRIQQENRLLEDELKSLQGAPPASKACKELIQFMESCPDPFITKSSLQVDPNWNRWFETPVDSAGCCCLGT